MTTTGDWEKVTPGTIVGPYRIRRGFQANGGQARVFSAEVRKKYYTPGMPKRVALKVARPAHQDALKREVSFLERFDHPNIVKIFPNPRHTGRDLYASRAQFPFGPGWYYAMELLDSGGLELYLTRTTHLTDVIRPVAPQQRPLNTMVAVQIAYQVIQALEHIHDHGIVNLDVKPANLLFRPRKFTFFKSSVPEIVLGDFGISRELRYPRRAVLGMATREYVSPEHSKDTEDHPAALDYRSDIFSLGVVLYEMLTGYLPFRNLSQLQDPKYAPEPPSARRAQISADLDRITLRALEKNPDDRFQSATEMGRALAQVSTAPDWPRIRRVFAGATLAVAIVGGLYGMAGHLVEGDPSKNPASIHNAPTITATFTPTPESDVILQPSLTPTPQSEQIQPTSTPRQ